MTTSIGRFALASALALSLSLTSAHAQTAPAPVPLQTLAEQKLAEGPPGSRFGMLVTTLDGEVLVSIAPDQRFIPASNTKMFTTAIAYAELPLLQQTAKGAGVRLEAAGNGATDVILHGRGDAVLSSAGDCKSDCLQTLADDVAHVARLCRDRVGERLQAIALAIAGARKHRVAAPV